MNAKDSGIDSIRKAIIRPSHKCHFCANLGLSFSGVDGRTTEYLPGRQIRECLSSKPKGLLHCVLQVDLLPLHILLYGVLPLLIGTSPKNSEPFLHRVPYLLRAIPQTPYAQITVWSIESGYELHQTGSRVTLPPYFPPYWRSLYVPGP